MAQALVRACEGVAAAANFLDIYIQAAVIRRDSSSLLGSWLSQEYQVTALLGQSSVTHIYDIIARSICHIKVSSSMAVDIASTTHYARGLFLLMQAARQTYARAGYVKYASKSSRMVPWAVDVDTSAELMYKQLHLEGSRELYTED